MKRLVKSVFLLIFVLCITVELGSPALALDVNQEIRDEEPLIPQYEHIMGITSSIQINQSSGRVTCNMTAVSRHTTDTLDVTLYLQKLSGNAWITVKWWESSDTQSFSMTSLYYITDAGTYRARVVTDVYDVSGNFVESIATKSATATYS